MTTPLEWEKLIAELESQARAVRTSEGAKTIKSKVQEAITHIPRFTPSRNIFCTRCLIIQE